MRISKKAELATLRKPRAVGHSCPLCGADRSSEFYGLGAPGRVRVQNRLCDECGLVFLHPKPDFADLREYYERYSRRTQPQIARIPASFEEQLLAISELRRRFLQPHLRPGWRVLDIGCGFGATLKTLRDASGMPLNLTGINPESEWAAFGAKRYGLDIRDGLFEDHSFDTSSFDLVILDNVLEHMEDPGATLERVHALLSPGGSIFVAVNSLDTPHGFYWQNFFADHVVSFSACTLEAMLASRGFDTVERDVSGHVTYQGYRYPYLYMLARKGEVPKYFDFIAAGDDPEERLRHARSYESGFFAERGAAKRRYELSLEKELSREDAAELSAIETQAAMEGEPMDYSPLNHTLAPEEFFRRRVAVAECRTEADEALAWKLMDASGLNLLPVIVRVTPDWKYIPRFVPGEAGVEMPGSFPLRRTMWAWIVEHFPTFVEGLSMRLYEADLPTEALARAHDRFSRSSLPWALADYRQFTPARFEFFREEAFTRVADPAQANTEANLCRHASPMMEDILWPDLDDCRYFYQERFEAYFSTPKAVVLDLYPGCNKVCGKCQFHSSASPHRKHLASRSPMPLEVALRLVREAAAIEPKPMLGLTFSGEPLLYPHLEEVIREAKRLGMVVSTFTNGLLLDESTARMLIELGMDSVTVSIDAADPETYSRLQPPGDLDKVRRSVDRLLELRGEATTPVVGVHFVMDRDNLDQFGPYLTYWKDRVDYVSRALRQDQFGSCNPILPTFSALGARRPCWAAWTCLYVRGDGSVSFCGFDIGADTSGLSVNDRSFLDCWRSEEFRYWREAQMSNDFKVLYCRACPGWSGQRKAEADEDGYVVARTPTTEVYHFKREGA